MDLLGFPKKRHSVAPASGLVAMQEGGGSEATPAPARSSAMGSRGAGGSGVFTGSGVIAFAVTLARQRGLVFGPGLVRYPPAAQASLRAIPPSGVLDLATYYRVPGQLVGYIEDFGVAFIQQQTVTFYPWVKRTQQFTTMQGQNYTS